MFIRVYTPKSIDGHSVRFSKIPDFYRSKKMLKDQEAALYTFSFQVFIKDLV